MSLRATWRHARATDYRRPGGPWDVPPLDLLLASDPRVDRVAGGLRARGVRRRDVVAWQAPNLEESVLLYRACWRLGAIATPIHHAAGEADIAAALTQVDPALVLAAPGLPLAGAPGAVDLQPTVRSFEESGHPVVDCAARPPDVAAVLFTAGSTGTPKAVLHTQRSLAYKARLMRAVHDLGPHDAVLMPAPLAHVSGLLNGITVPGVARMRTVLMARWDPAEAVDIIERERITFMIGPPTFFVSLMSAPNFTAEKVASLRLISSGGAGVTSAFIDEATETLRCVVKRTYGSTEAPTVATSFAGDPPDRCRETDGRSTGDAELRVTDPATGRPVPAGERGELWLRGPELFEGYADAAQTAATTTRGWFRTGDLAVVDVEGWLRIVGRIKDIIIRGGENIAAAEVEGHLEAHPAVRQGVAVGYPDERLGERVAAFVVASGTFDLDTCRAWFEERGVTRFKTPERVIQVDELPVLAAGKADRAALKARLA